MHMGSLTGAPMANRGAAALAVSMALLLLGTGSVSAGFYDSYDVIWAAENIIPNDALNEVTLRMTDSAGASFKSKDTYLFGSFSVKYKLVPGNSAGTVTAFYLTSYEAGHHDEIDFEFLGNETGQPYLLHTNVFVGGVGSRESQFTLWFDPSADYHNYTVVWNHKQITWFVDDIPVRIHKNVAASVYPSTKSMGGHGTLFEASSWATRGGAVPIDWTAAPFQVSYKDFTFNACKVQGGDTSLCTNPAMIQGNYWESAQFQALNPVQVQQLRDVRSKFMTYDYCLDRVRFPQIPLECSSNAV